VDNSGDFVGVMADWCAFARGRRPYPLAARGGCGCIDYQPGYWTASGLEVLRKGGKFSAKAQRKTFKLPIHSKGFPLRLCVFLCVFARETILPPQDHYSPAPGKPGLPH
jgi:hypothetical protein